MPTPERVGSLVDLAIPLVGALFAIFLPKKPIIAKHGPQKGRKIVLGLYIVGGVLLLATVIRGIYEFTI